MKVLLTRICVPDRSLVLLEDTRSDGRVAVVDDDVARIRPSRRMARELSSPSQEGDSQRGVFEVDNGLEEDAADEVDVEAQEAELLGSEARLRKSVV